MGGYRNIFYTPLPYTKNCFGGLIKNDITEMIHLLTFQSIKNVLYFLNFGGGYRNIFYTPTPYTKKIVLGGIKNDVTEMIHLLTFQSINNVLYF